MNVSVVIPCYNAESYLAQTIGSALDQSRPPREIIVVDDGSTDGSLAVARRFEAGCGGVVRVYAEHSGRASRTRNIGASLATGDALMFLDADDLLSPDVFESLTDALSRRPGAIAACPWRRLECEDGKWMSRPASCARRKQSQDTLSAWLSGWYYPTCSVLWSREAFVHTGGWDEEATLNDDGDLVMRAFVMGIPLVESKVGTSYYRRLPEGQISMSDKRYTYEGLAGRIAVREKIARLLEEQGRIDAYREPISRSLALIAADAAGRYPGLSQQAWQRSRHFAPATRSRLWAAAHRRLLRIHSSRPGAVLPRDSAEEIRFGADVAARVLGSASPSQMNEPSMSPPSTQRPTVSVIIPTYNRAHLLPRALDSVLNQTFTDFEVLVVDDCSSDDPASVVAGYHDSRLRYLLQPRNQGVAAARNRGMREARAPFVAFLDDDDEWFPEKLAMQVDVFRRAPADLGLIYTGVETVSDDGQRAVRIPTARGNLYREFLVRNLLHGGSSAMVRRNVITSVGFFDEDLPAIEDYDYWLRISRHYRVDCVDVALVRYFDLRGAEQNAGSQVRRSLAVKANFEARNQFYRKHGAHMRREGLAHLFLVESAHRHVRSGWNDARGARRLALQAFRQAPGSRATLGSLLSVFAPAYVHNRLRSISSRMRKGAVRP